MARDPQSKIDRIVAAAITEFARAGPEGARIDAIAREAGMNKRLLYHYVGGKDALFDTAVTRCRAVLEEAGGELDHVPAEVWRILCHAEASGRGPAIRALAEVMRRAGEPGGEAARRVAMTMLRSLLPSLAESLSGRSRAQQLETDQKPRVKLKPELRRAPGRD